MSDIWFLSDHHFNHSNIIRFTGYDGQLIRPGFKDIKHMNEHLVEMHNSVVKPGHKVYFGGDLGQHAPEYLLRMNGRKRLILGNHDDKLDKRVWDCFDKILSWRFFGHTSKRFVVSHYPLHPMSFEYRGSKRGEPETKGCYNVHGHIHEKTVMLDGKPDLRYFNICAEKLNYTPINLDTLIERLGK